MKQKVKKPPIGLVRCEKTGNLEVIYKPLTPRTVYDICDMNGRILKTGDIDQIKTSIELSDLLNDQYILLILDGDCIVSKRFHLNRPNGI